MMQFLDGRTFFIDDVGNVWDNVDKFCTQVARQSDVRETRRFLVKSMGFVEFTIGDRHVRLQLRPSHVSGPTIAGLCFLLGDLPSTRCSAVLHDDKDATSHVILPPSGCCAAAVENLVARAREARFEVLSTRRLGPKDLANLPPLQKALDYWLNWPTNHNDTAFEQLLREDLGGRYVVFNQMIGAGALRISRVGPGLPEFAVKTLGLLKGRDTDLIHPDPAYGKACASAYAEALDRWEPLIEDVEAKAFWPHFGRLRRRYTRLILPFCAAESCGVLSATLASSCGLTLNRAI
ncbi:MAG: hypothetical protein ACKVP7_25860 [Hyphomicrobiaceae bacterium]